MGIRLPFVRATGGVAATGGDDATTKLSLLRLPTGLTWSSWLRGGTAVGFVGNGSLSTSSNPLLRNWKQKTHSRTSE
jgi:hypothetical protein